MKVVITGGTRGIGLALVNRFLKAGSDILLCSGKAEDLKKLQEQLSTEFPAQQILSCCCDLSKPEETEAFCKFQQTSFPGPDILINNAGIFEMEAFENGSESSFDRMMQVNFLSARMITKNIYTQMISHRAGQIFFICSSVCKVPKPGMSAYSISKNALYALANSIREEASNHGVKVSTVIPGSTYTSSWEGTSIDKNRFIQPEDIAEIIYTAATFSSASVMEEIIINPIKPI